MEDTFHLFVITASLLTFAMPAAAQTIFALFAAALAVAACSTPGDQRRGAQVPAG